eukprot:TRINITY_DN4137_c2_g1_i2.p1 TRINITY_DN4137_c2_g1~~TRINITY_DN4137_c2_g1_i2.p1  ORF type:complete len:200 (+),score=11.73 TRINITY_DN4137_c2_g1_i2:135-734(+)
MEQVCTIGICGCSRSGKSRLANALRSTFEDRKCPVVVVNQDPFWYTSAIVQLPCGKQKRSEEEPACTNWDSFSGAVAEARRSCAAKGGGVVIVEGFQMLHDERVRDFVLPTRERQVCFFLDLPREDCIARRSAATGPFNPNSKGRTYCEDILWPAYERYVTRCIEPVREQLHRVDATLGHERVVADVIGVLRERGIVDR